MDLVLRSLFAATLPPPPAPDSAGGDGGIERSLLVAAGLAVAVLAAFGIGVLVGRLWAGRGASGRPCPVAFRIELWHDGEAEVLGHAGDPATGAPTFADHLARLRCRGARGALVLIEPVSDAIVDLRPIQRDEAEGRLPAGDG